MKPIRYILILALALTIAGCSKYKPYHGPEITQVVVNKGDRRMYLLHNEKVLKAYDIGLGFAPVGDKKIEGDGRTPEGNYVIDRRNYNSAFFLSIGISYPNEQDIAEALALGKSPGGDIFIHGRPNGVSRMNFRDTGPDWTAGCIAVTNREMREIYGMVRNGTPIQINP
ncbi:L,D-transpeptidase family protein [Thalassococcus sp. CAU 1522]|uniref:L,D-transpeptidase family protein n=1 Tax=Thalassococcus arenae TaxID=2851652 RepID=A0ABS6N7F6_9RHOB|nr:L,D-transpeptidase family protein [Thalassococcus arenae]MBV2359460.1 L,D-transpeptidase family protein [Thalassococcus arenae]